MGSDRPLAEIRDHESGGGHGGQDFKGSVAQGGEKITVIGEIKDRDEKNKNRADAEIPAEFLVLQKRAEPVADQETEIKGKIDAEEKHENGDNNFYRNAVKRSDAGAVIAETAGAGG